MSSRILLTWAALALGPLSFVSPGRTNDHEHPHEPEATAEVFEHGQLTGSLLRPAGTNPAGVVLVLHDALGPDPRAAIYADHLLSAGIAVVIVQNGAENADAVALAAAALARDDPRTSGLAVGLLGFGAGGRLALRTTTGIAAQALLYPGCIGIATERPAPGLPVMLLHGDADEANPPDACADVADWLGRSGNFVRHLMYPGAGYGWDHPVYGMERRMLLPRPDMVGRIAIEPWPALALVSATQVAGFFSGVFARRR